MSAISRQEFYDPPQTGLDHDRLVVIVNPISTNYKDGQDFILDVVEDSPYKKPEFLQSHPNADDTLSELEDTMRDGDLLLVIGGDGLLNIIAQHAARRHSARYSIMTSQTGDACNAHKATTPLRWRKRPSRLINEGVVIPVHPIRARIEAPDAEPLTELAVTVFSVGAMATGAAMLEQPQHQQSRWHHNKLTRFPYQAALSFSSLPSLRSLEITGLGNPEPHLLMDFIVANAAGIAKAARFGTEFSEFDMIAAVIQNGRHLPLAPARLMSKSLLPLPHDHVSEGADTFRLRLTDSERNKQALYQVDGEARPLPPGSGVGVDQVGYNDLTHRPISFLFLK